MALKESPGCFISKKPFSKVIGVLGGMGPEATIQFYEELIKICQKEYGSKYDDDFPNIIIYNLPISDIVEGIKNPDKIIKTLRIGIKTLERAGVDFIVLPCNTINYFYKDMIQIAKVPILNIIEETAKVVKSKGFRKVGLLATNTTIKTKLYKNIFKKYNLKLLLPNKLSRELTNKIILSIMNGKKSEKDRKLLVKIINEFKNKGAEGVILGCTELPLLISQNDISLSVFDSINVLAKATIDYSVLKENNFKISIQKILGGTLK